MSDVNLQTTLTHTVRVDLTIEEAKIMLGILNGNGVSEKEFRSFDGMVSDLEYAINSADIEDINFNS